jgi:hypothetical protein
MFVLLLILVLACLCPALQGIFDMLLSECSRRRHTLRVPRRSTFWRHS